jgi:CBS domain-containing protein
VDGPEHASFSVVDAHDRLVRDVMVSRPKTLSVDATVADVRRLFEDHPGVRTALLVEGSRFAGALEREDIPDDAALGEPALQLVRDEVATVGPELQAGEAATVMESLGTRRLVVLDPDGYTLLGLVCVTSDGDAFCSG